MNYNDLLNLSEEFTTITLLEEVISILDNEEMLEKQLKDLLDDTFPLDKVLKYGIDNEYLNIKRRRYRATDKGIDLFTKEI